MVGKTHRELGFAEDMCVFWEDAIDAVFKQGQLLETERKQAEETLRRHEQEFRALAENAPDIVARLDRNLRYLYVNPAVIKHTGIPREQFIGRTSEELNMPVEQTRLRNSTLMDVSKVAKKKICIMNMSLRLGLNITIPALPRSLDRMEQWRQFYPLPVIFLLLKKWKLPCRRKCPDHGDDTSVHCLARNTGVGTGGPIPAGPQAARRLL